MSPPRPQVWQEAVGGKAAAAAKDDGAIRTTEGVNVELRLEPLSCVCPWDGV